MKLILLLALVLLESASLQSFAATQIRAACPRALKQHSITVKEKRTVTQNLKIAGREDLLDSTGRYSIVQASDPDERPGSKAGEYLIDGQARAKATIDVKEYGAKGWHHSAIGVAVDKKSPHSKNRYLLLRESRGTDEDEEIRVVRVDLDTKDRKILAKNLDGGDSHRVVYSPDRTKMFYTTPEWTNTRFGKVVDVLSGSTRVVRWEWPRGCDEEFFSPTLDNTGRILTSRCGNKEIVWDTSEDLSAARTISGRILKSSENGEWIVTTNGSAGQFQYYRIEDGKPIRTRLTGEDFFQIEEKRANSARGKIKQSRGVLDAKTSPDGRYLVLSGGFYYRSETFSGIVSADGSAMHQTADFDEHWVLTQWDLQGNEPMRNIDIPFHGTRGAGSFDFTIQNSGEIVVAGSNDTQLFIWSPKFLGLIQAGEDEERWGGLRFRFSGDGKTLAVMNNEKVAHLSLDKMEAEAMMRADHPGLFIHELEATMRGYLNTIGQQERALELAPIP